MKKYRKKAQEQKSKILATPPMRGRRKAQEEMVGFALIIIIVAVILLVLLSISLRSPREEVESYKVGSFIQAFLQYTSDCSDDSEYLSIKDLIFDCDDGRICLDGRSACEALDSTLKGIVEESWKVGTDRPIIGYELRILSNDEEVFLLTEGNVTRNYKWSMQPFSKRGSNFEVFFTVYY